MFLCQIFVKNTKNDIQTLFEASKSVIFFKRQITGKSQNDVKSACFWHVLCHISAVLEDIDLKFCAHINQLLPFKTIVRFVENFDFEGENFEKKTNCCKFGKI